MSDEICTSLVSLCEKEEWEIISGLIPKMIHLWNLEEKNEEGNNPLIICCMKGALDVLQQLYFSKSKIIYPDTTYGEDTSVLYFPCSFGHLEIVKWLNENGSSLDDGDLCLLFASANGHLETIKYLVQNGCSIDERNDDGDSCLLLAARNGHLKTVKYLLENGCSIAEMDCEGNSSLILASINGHLETIIIHAF